ncbi:Type II restriction endonuclease [Bifidobacterium pseudolongum subsp. globosum]|nr:Type II restriction endonuclease [Bifidobacterium pseudolongum subsp. globosum]
MITHAQKEEIARQTIARYQAKRLESYQKMHLPQLLGKDVLLFAARGVTTASAFVDEAFRAAESSSEETVMGSTRQELAILLSNSADTGDMTVVRDGVKYYCEMKSQTNTTNFGSLAAVLQELKYDVDNDRSRAHRTVTNQRVGAALLISRSSKTVDEERVFHCDSIAKQPYSMLEGFTYRFISGRAMWQWVADVDDPIELVQPLTNLDDGRVSAARSETLFRLHDEMNRELIARHLSDSIDSVYELVKSTWR